MEHVNPSTEERSVVTETAVSEIDTIVRASASAQEVWAETPIEGRTAAFSRFAELLEGVQGELAREIAREMGKPLRLARLEVERSVNGVAFFNEHIPAWLAPEETRQGHVYFEPMGVVAIITPWNFPVWLPVQALCQALLAGNGVLFKPSELTPRCGRILCDLLRQAGTPSGLVGLVIGGGPQGQAVVQHPLVQMISFTGSVATGKRVMETAARRVAKVSLELGGLDAAVVLSDADVEEAAERLVADNAHNSGQVCIAVKRVYAEAPIYQNLLEAISRRSAHVRVGDPFEEVDMGPLGSAEQLAKVEAFLDDAKARGARVVTGGQRISGQGYFFPHTVLAEVPPQARLLHEEPFGPILPVLPVGSADEAVMLANAVPYGLGASVWTKDVERGREIARRLDAGMVRINGHGAGPLGTPFGGVKQSGIGRLRWRDGAREFTNVKYVGH